MAMPDEEIPAGAIVGEFIILGVNVRAVQRRCQTGCCRPSASGGATLCMAVAWFLSGL